MRGFLLWFPGASVAVGAALYACSSNQAAPQPSNDAGADVATDANLGAPTCVTSQTPAPFPPDSCGSPQPAQPDAFDEALGLVQLNRCSLKLTWSGLCFMNSADPLKMPDFTALLTFPLRLPAYGAEMSKWLDDAMNGPTPVASALAAASQRRGAPLATTDCADATWFVVDGNDTSPLASALIEVDGNLDPGATSQAVSGVPLDLQRALVPIVRAIGYGAQDVTDALSSQASHFTQLKLTPDLIVGGWPYDINTTPFAAFEAVDVAKMTVAASRIATAIEAAKLGQFAGKDVPTTEIDTAFGAIVIHGATSDTYMPGSKADGAALLLDMGGDDIYRVPVAAGSLTRPVSVAIDLAGKDLYAYVEKPVPADNAGHRLPSDGAGRSQGVTSSRVSRQGSGVLGVGLLFDLGTDNDTYRSLTVSQGTGVLGVGVLFDQGGDDNYTVEALGQGAGAWGIGLLLDGAGTDSYTTYNSAQGYGFSRGFGALVDMSGNDTYYSDPGDPSLGGDQLYPSAQLPGPPSSTLAGNFSMSQGAGEGYRPDTPLPPHQFTGGMGVLRDATGNDKYTTGVFGQATAFAMGMGFLLDGAGDDTYAGLWYVQGSAAHTGITYFHDSSGADKYNPSFPIQATSIGVGHDCSASVHYDEGGDDQYNAPWLSLGGGNAAGMGIFVNVGGNDSFTSPSSYAAGGTGFDYHPNSPVVGVFVKAKGSSTYSIPNGAAPGGSWNYTTTLNDAGIAKSVGIDRPSGNATLP